MEQGLPQATARALVQDRDGFVWIATQDGLARFDGHDFEVFRHVPGDPSGLGDNYITALAVATDGTLWIGTRSGGLNRRDAQSGELSTYRSGAEGEPDLFREQVTALLEHNGALLIAGGDGRVHVWSDGAIEPVPLRLGTDVGAIRRLQRGRSGELLIAARGGAFRCDGDHRCEAIGVMGSEAPLDAHDILDEGDHLWVAAETGLYRFDSDLHLVERLHDGLPAPRRLAGTAVRALLRDRHGRLWVGTMNGLSMLSGRDDTVHSWRHQPGRFGSLAASRVQSLLEDRDGLLWVGTWTNGLSLLDPRTEAFVSLAPDPDDPRSLPGSAVPGLWADPDGTLWLGVLAGGGLVQVDPSLGLLARYVHDANDPASLSHDFVQFITRDRSGVLWVATQGGGLNRLREDGSGFDRFLHDRTDPHSLPSNFLLHLHADRNNTLWIATADRGLAWLCPGCDRFGHVVDVPDQPDALGANTVNSSFEDSQGRLWVALRPGGISLLDRERMRFSRIVAEPGREDRLSSNTITVVFEDSRGDLWFGTQGGGLYALLEYDGQASTFRRFSRSEGLGSDAIGGIIEDASGRVWVSTTTGISRVDPVSGAIDNFGAREGAQSTGYFIGSYGRIPDGRMAFGGLSGVTLFQPEHVPAREPAGRVVFTRITSLGARELYPDPLRLADHARGQGRIALPYPASDLLVEFSALAFATPDSVVYRYRLDGLDADWIEAAARHRFAAYTNLPAGRYLLRAQAWTSAGAGEESTLEVAVGASRWQHPLAQAVYALAALGVLAVFALQLRGRWRERERAQAALSQSEERLKLALWGSGDELWDINLSTGELRRENPLPHIAASRRNYVARAASLREILHPDDVSAFDHAFAQHLRGEAESIEIAYRVRDMAGEWCWLRLRGRVVMRGDDGKPLRVSGTVGDIDALKRSERALQALNQALEQRVAERTADLTAANEKLHRTVAELKRMQRHLVESEKMAALGGLVAGIAHEINTPIGIGVTAASHLQAETRRMRRKLDNGELKPSDLDAFASAADDSVDMILRNLGRADKLVRSFKQVAVDQGSEERREIDLASYLDEILTSLQPTLKRTRIAVRLNCPKGLMLTTLPGAIYQIMVNLVMNSLIHAFDPDQEGTIAIEVVSDGGWIHLTYTDDGRGMSDEARHRIFEPFFTTRRGHGGSGLGMHIVYNLVTQALHGHIDCDSAPGRGIYIGIRMPLG
ncbi:MAG TPA: two-component regulator propeller domain-containing protein [Xanthomonadaceae bacterium]|nr:two-component regulator propeller domain-containing protein [Xanthomonadaceae bacterium]